MFLIFQINFIRWEIRFLKNADHDISEQELTAKSWWLKKEKMTDLFWMSMSGMFRTEISKSKNCMKEMQRMKGK